MQLGALLNDLGALISLALGLNAVLRPHATARFVSLQPEGRMGLSELRATYGGLFAAMGAFCLLAQDQVAFAVLGAGWVGAALGRALSVLVDDSREKRNLGGILFEAAIAVLLLFPA